MKHWSLSLLLLLGVSCRLVTLPSLPKDVGSVYRAPQTPDASWYETSFNDNSWERLNTNTLSKQPNTTFLRIPFDVGASAETVTDVYLSFPEKPNFQQAYLNGYQLIPDPDVQRDPKTLGFQLPKNKLKPEGNLLALSFAPNQTLQTPYIDPVFPDSADQHITQGPYLLSPSTNGIIVAFETQKDCLATVNVNGTPFYEYVAAALPASQYSGERSYHWVIVSNLQPNSRYNYTVQCPDNASSSGAILAKGSLATAPTEDSAVSLVAIAPSANLSLFANAAMQAKRLSPDLVVLLGGSLPGGMDKYAWNDLFRAGYGLFLRSATISALSAHRSASGSLRSNATLFALPDSEAGIGRAFSQDYGIVHTAVVDSDALFNPKVKQWLKEDIKQATTKNQRTIIVLSRNAFGGVHDRVGKSLDAILEDTSPDLIIATGNEWFELGVSPKGKPYLLQGEPDDERQFSLIEASPLGVWVRTYDSSGAIVDDVKTSARE